MRILQPRELVPAAGRGLIGLTVGRKWSAAGYGLQLQWAQAVLPWLIDVRTNHAAVPILASGSKGEAPPKPASAEDHAQVLGMNW